MPETPGLFSITTRWPSLSDNNGTINLAIESTPPPAVYGTIRVIGFCGKEVDWLYEAIGASPMTQEAILSIQKAFRHKRFRKSLIFILSPIIYIFIHHNLILQLNRHSAMIEHPKVKNIVFSNQLMKASFLDFLTRKYLI
jgi:hypothetical protein